MASGSSPNPFGVLLRRLRLDAGLTQEELAERARLSWRAISDLERGIKLVPRRETVALLVEALALTGDARVAFETAARRPAPDAPVLPIDPQPVPDAPPLPTGRYLGASPLLPLVAREREMARILAALEAGTGGQGRTLLLAGEAGVGKTRLAQETMQRARAAHHLVLVGRCYQEHTTSPFFPFLEVLGNAWEAAPETLRRQAAQRYAGLGQLVPELLPTSSIVEGEDPRLRLLRAVAGFLHALARLVPLVLLLDDLHWADSSSMDLLLHLARALHGERVLLLGTYRDTEVDAAHPFDGVIAQLLRERLVDVITVPRLPLAGTSTLIGTHFGMTGISADLTGLVHERTDGNPFFIEEVLTSLVETGILYQEEGRWERKSIVRLEVPFSVRAMVSQRVGQLPAVGQDLLRAASVLGQEFDLDILLATLGQEEDVVLTGLDAALALRLLEERQVSRGERFAFVHALVLQALYDEVPRYRLRRLHLRAGEALLRARGERPDVFADLARHFLAAADEERAARYAELAGDQAMRLYARAEAEGHYRTALSLRQARGERAAAATLGRKLGEVLTAAQRPDEARDVLEAARTIATELGDAYALALIHHRLAAVAGVHGNHPEAIPHLERALALWPAERENVDLARLLYDATCSIGTIQGTADPYARRLIDLAERLGDPAIVALSIANMFWLSIGTDMPFQEMLLPLGRAMAMAEQAEDWWILADLQLARAMGLSVLGDLRGGLAEYKRIIPTAERGDYPMLIMNAQWGMARLYVQMGDWVAAREAAQAAQAASSEYTDHHLLSWTSGEYAAGIAGLQRKLDEMREQHLQSGILFVSRDLIDSLLQLGRWEEAASLAREALALLPEHPIKRRAADLLPTLVEALACVGDPVAASLLEEADALLASYGYLCWRPRLVRAQGLVLARAGRTDEALVALQASASEARAQGAQVELGRTLAALIAHARTGGDEALAASVAAEHAALLERIGPEVRRLAWAK